MLSGGLWVSSYGMELLTTAALALLIFYTAAPVRTSGFRPVRV